MSGNPLKWLQIEQLGREFHSHLKPALDQLSSGADELSEEAEHGLQKVSAWLGSPCVATVKLDGTNLGVDCAGLVVGRNCIVEPGERYQTVDVFGLLDGYAEKAARLRNALADEAAGEPVAQAMLYGELLVNGKYDYARAGIFRSWLCFGAMLRPAAADEGAAARLSLALGAAGFTARPTDGRVLLAMNPRLLALLGDAGVPTVAGAYQPTGSVTESQWAEHDGEGRLACFRSLRHLICSPWAQRILLPADGAPLGEGLVVASEADGTLFKWKHAGEELGRVPQQLADLAAALEGLKGAPREALLPAGLHEVVEQLLLVATTKPSPAAEAPKSAAAAPAPRKAKQKDPEASVAWESALTKFNSLEAAFTKGKKATRALQVDLIQQVADDLAKDYGAPKEDAGRRATAVVQREMDRCMSQWNGSR